jgi:hypothetical protein
MPRTLHPVHRAAARYRRALAALLPAAALAAAFPAFASAGSAAAATQAVLRPDLIVTMIVVLELPGNPPYIVVDESTHAPGFMVKVVTKNVGTATAPASVTELKLQQAGETRWEKQETVGKLTPGMFRTSTFVVDTLKADPGMLHAVATADATNKIRELNDKNNTRTRRPIPVIPRDWKVVTFRTAVNPGGGLSVTTQTASGFYYRFSRFDKSKKWFVYKGYGQVNDQADLVGAGCAGHGRAHDSQDPWPGTDSELVIRGDLSGYSAGVDTTGEPGEHLTVTCTGGAKFSYPYGWNSLVTWVGTHSFPSMKTDATTLDGEGKALTPAGPAKFTWIFNARVSGV